MATTATPRQNKVLSVMSNLLSYKKSVKNGNEKDVQQVSSGCCCVVLSLLSMHTAINSRDFTATYLHCVIQVSSDMVVRRHGGSGSNLVRASYLHMIYRIVNDRRIITSDTHIDLFAHHIMNYSQWFQVT